MNFYTYQRNIQDRFEQLQKKSLLRPVQYVSGGGSGDLSIIGNDAQLANFNQFNTLISFTGIPSDFNNTVYQNMSLTQAIKNIIADPPDLTQVKKDIQTNADNISTLNTFTGYKTPNPITVKTTDGSNIEDLTTAVNRVYDITQTTQPYIMSADQKAGIQNSSFKSYYNMLGFTPEWLQEIVDQSEGAVKSYQDIILLAIEDSGKIGDLLSLTIPGTADIVSAINYLNSKIGQDFNISSKDSQGNELTTLLQGVNLIGDMSSLTTSSKDTLVKAINIISTFTGYNSTNPITTKNQAGVIQTSLVDAINLIGDLSQIDNITIAEQLLDNKTELDANTSLIKTNQTNITSNTTLINKNKANIGIIGTDPELQVIANNTTTYKTLISLIGDTGNWAQFISNRVSVGSIIDVIGAYVSNKGLQQYLSTLSSLDITTILNSVSTDLKKIFGYNTTYKSYFSTDHPLYQLLGITKQYDGVLDDLDNTLTNRTSIIGAINSLIQDSASNNYEAYSYFPINENFNNLLFTKLSGADNNNFSTFKTVFTNFVKIYNANSTADLNSFKTTLNNSANAYENKMYKISYGDEGYYQFGIEDNLFIFEYCFPTTTESNFAFAYCFKTNYKKDITKLNDTYTGHIEDYTYFKEGELYLIFNRNTDQKKTNIQALTVSALFGKTPIVVLGGPQTKNFVLTQLPSFGANIIDHVTCLFSNLKQATIIIINSQIVGTTISQAGISIFNSICTNITTSSSTVSGHYNSFYYCEIDITTEQTLSITTCENCTITITVGSTEPATYTLAFTAATVENSNIYFINTNSTPTTNLLLSNTNALNNKLLFKNCTIQYSNTLQILGSYTPSGNIQFSSQIIFSNCYIYCSTLVQNNGSQVDTIFFSCYFNILNSTDPTAILNTPAKQLFNCFYPKLTQ